MVFAVLILGVDPARAQVNTDSLLGTPTAPGAAVAIGGSAGLSSGNVASVWWKGETTLAYVTLFPEDEDEDEDEEDEDEDEDDDDDDEPPPFLHDRALLYASANRASYSGDIVDDSGLAHLRFTRMWVPRFGTEVFAQLQYDRFVDLRERLLTGAGVRVDAVHEAHAELYGGTGVMFERETLSDGTVNANVRSTSYITVNWEIVDDHLTLSNTAYLQPRVDLPEDFRFLDEGRLAAKVTGALSLGTDLSVRHDSRPPVDVLPTDVRFGSSFQLKWKEKPRASASD
ncbi:MAG: DUF481 domain-containing protein [Myxococcota bacterium]